MTLDEYQREAMRTAGSAKGDAPGLSMTALGLTGEAGEYADLIKKHLFHEHALDVAKAKKELGDVLWYVAVAASQLGLTLDQVAEANVVKLRLRYPRGFDPALSQQRKPGDS